MFPKVVFLGDYNQWYFEASCQDVTGLYKRLQEANPEGLTNEHNIKTTLWVGSAPLQLVSCEPQQHFFPSSKSSSVKEVKQTKKLGFSLQANKENSAFLQAVNQARLSQIPSACLLSFS